MALLPQAHRLGDRRASGTQQPRPANYPLPHTKSTYANYPTAAVAIAVAVGRESQDLYLLPNACRQTERTAWLSSDQRRSLEREAAIKSFDKKSITSRTLSMNSLILYLAFLRA